MLTYFPENITVDIFHRKYMYYCWHMSQKVLLLTYVPESGRLTLKMLVSYWCMSYISILHNFSIMVIQNSWQMPIDHADISADIFSWKYYCWHISPKVHVLLLTYVPESITVDICPRKYYCWRKSVCIKWRVVQYRTYVLGLMSSELTTHKNNTLHRFVCFEYFELILNQIT